MILIPRSARPTTAAGLVNCAEAIIDRLDDSADPLGADGWETMDAYAKVDHYVRAGDDTVADPEGCYLAQTDAAFLDAVAKHHPDATIFLNVRRFKSWLAAVDRSTRKDHRFHRDGLRGQLTACGFPGLAAGVGDRAADMLAWYESHKARIRAYAREHPSLTLVEVDVEDPGAGAQLAAATGLPDVCWVPPTKDD